MHEQEPDIIYLHPTLSVHEGLHYGHYAGVIEVKPRTSQDPIKDGKLHQTIDARKTIVQIAKNAQSLLIDNMSCFVFVIGIYGHMARVYRFDRAGVIVSPSFDYKISPTILGQFFYQLVHPAAPATSGIVGADHAITPTRSDEKVVLLLTLVNVHKYTFNQAAAALNPSYRFDVKVGMMTITDGHIVSQLGSHCPPRPACSCYCCLGRTHRGSREWGLVCPEGLLARVSSKIRTCSL